MMSTVDNDLPGTVYAVQHFDALQYHIVAGVYWLGGWGCAAAGLECPWSIRLLGI